MSNQKESTARTLLVALLVCLVCSVLVAGAAVALKPIQVVNSQLDKQRNILAIAGLGDPSMSAADVQRLFDERIVARLVNLETGQFSDEHDPTTFDPLAAAREPSASRVLTGAEDIASIKRLEKFSVVYIVEDASGDMETLVLPIRGYGLWSTLHGFLALESDLTTVQGLGFYQHAETPGLGGEVDNPRGRGPGPGLRQGRRRPRAGWGVGPPALARAVARQAGRRREWHRRPPPGKGRCRFHRPGCLASGRWSGGRDPDRQWRQQSAALLAG